MSFVNWISLYEKGDLKRKWNIIGSVFPEKLTFDGFYYRTTRINEAVRLICVMDNELDKNKNRQPEENFKLSIPVDQNGFELQIVMVLLIPLK